jgi:hypothetical protein
MFFNVLPGAVYDALGDTLGASNDALGARNGLGRRGAGGKPDHQEGKSKQEKKPITQIQGSLSFLLQSVTNKTFFGGITYKKWTPIQVVSILPVNF